ncbi:MAG: hypothetical protein ACK5Y6_02035, partial [Pseudomonadota bacterium]
ERLGGDRFHAARAETAQVAIDYTNSLFEVARLAGIALAAPVDLGYRHDRAIVMAGHQPLIYHPGLMAKTAALARFAADSDAFGINVVIDTDLGDGGSITWPKISGSNLEIKSATLVGGKTGSEILYSAQRLADRGVIEEIFKELVSDLLTSGLDSSANKAAKAGQLYAALAGQPVAAAHTIVRWASNGGTQRFLEAPLSAVLAAPALSAVLKDLVIDRQRLVSIYNQTLEEYRASHRISNPANPFPNMKVGESSLELPLWIVSSSARRPCVCPKDGLELASDERLVTRGSITTFILRSYCSDLFIHGTGGAKYDLFVDSFAERYLDYKLPRYVVASATRHIKPERVAELERAITLAASIKEMTSKTESFLGQGIFSAAEESELASISLTRQELRDALSKAQSPTERSAVAQRLNAANKIVRELIESGSLRQIIASAPANQAALTRWSYREFPFFLW